MDESYAGPTASELQPKDRLEKGLLYHEHLEMMVGAEVAAKGVHLEIVHVQLTVAQLKVDGSGRKTKPAILVTFKAPAGFRAPPGVQFDGRSLPWRLATNQTNKRALASLHDGDEVVTRWVGWVTLYVDPRVEDNKTGGLTKGIRIKNVRPRLPPTFDYVENVKMRIEKAREAKRAEEAKAAQRGQAQQQPLMSQTEIEAIEDEERK